MVHDIKRILLDQACLYTEFQADDFKSAVEKIAHVFYPGGARRDSNADLRRTIVNELLAAERQRSFALDCGVLIPHLPMEDESRAGWFRSPQGVPTGIEGHPPAYIIFFALAPDAILRDVMGYACEILRSRSFRDEFLAAKTADGLRHAVVAHYHRYFERRVSDKEQWRERADSWASRVWGASENNNTAYTRVVIKNRRGLDARFSALVVGTVSSYDCDAIVCARDAYASGLSILGMMMLAVGCGGLVEVIAKGREAEELIEVLEEILEYSVDDVLGAPSK